MEWITEPQAWIGLLTLTALEIVLGIDNIVFISILTGRLPAHEQGRARTLGLAVAMISRILLLFSLTWIMRLTQPLFHIFAHAVSGRDIILFAGGLFLLAKSTHEIHAKLEGAEGGHKPKTLSFWGVIFQIMVLDVVFSLDSVITAVGMISEIAIMVTAIVIAVIVMMIFSRSVSDFVERHPTVKMLALSFLLMIGLLLIADGSGFHIPKGYAYFAMAFSVFVEMLNLKMGARAKPVHLHQPYEKK